MQALKEFLKDRSIWIALFAILSTETGMQLGCYKPFLKKSSYARIVNTVSEKAIQTLPTLKPNVLLVGTSVVFEGISLPRLNEKLHDSGIVVQSIAIPGSELIVQELILRKVIEHPNQIQVVIHMNELQLPWVDRREIIDSSLTMISELDRRLAYQKLAEDKYVVKWENYLSMAIRWIGYHNDIADLLLRPDKRWKEFFKARKVDPSYPYVYVNEYLPSLQLYSFAGLQDCHEKTKLGSMIPEGSNKFHMDAVNKTCQLMVETKLPVVKNEHTSLFYSRLTNFYSFIRSKGLRVIPVFPPISLYVDPDEMKKRKSFWETEFAETLGNQRLDLTDAIPMEGNALYYYDLIHVNRPGMEVFTDRLASEILKNSASWNLAKEGQKF